MTLQAPAVVLLSGGLDSATTLAMAREMGFDCHALSFDYGQRHRFELDAARAVAASMDVADHRVATIDLRLFGGSALTDDIDVPKDQRQPEEGSASSASSIPVTYVPARNTIFLSFALAFAEVIESNDIFIGVNAVDYSGYPDCRPEYIEAFQAMADFATRRGVSGSQITIHAPLVHLAKRDIIERGTALGVDYALTLSCYDPLPSGGINRWRACGRCDSCLLRAQGFKAAGMPDPALAERDAT